MQQPSFFRSVVRKDLKKIKVKPTYMVIVGTQSTCQLPLSPSSAPIFVGVSVSQTPTLCGLWEDN